MGMWWHAGKGGWLTQAWAAAAALMVSMVWQPTPAHACGGCFHEEPAANTTPEASIVTGHRMAISVSSSQTVLWDSVSYDGSPEDFAWVLPVGPGAEIQLSTNAFLEALEAVTQTTVHPPPLTCAGGSLGNDVLGGGVGCGESARESDSAASSAGFGGASSSSGGGTGVRVLHEETVGPYDAVVIRSRQPGAIMAWLRTNHYAVAQDMEPVLGSYETQGADFLALRLAPGAMVRQMRPVRVVYPGTLLSFPLRMVQAGTGLRTGVVLYILGEGRWGVGNGNTAQISAADIVFDFSTGRSNYQQLRQEALAANGGNAWLTTYARRGAVFLPTFNPGINAQEVYVASNWQGSTDRSLDQLYVSQGLANEETTSSTCRAALAALGSDERVVVNPCDGDGNCRAVTSEEIDARTLACDDLDDLATALVGMRPTSVWLTRVEAELPRSALEQDLMLGAAASQRLVEHNVVAAEASNAPCPVDRTQASLDPARNIGNLVTLYGPVALGALWVRRRRKAAKAP